MLFRRKMERACAYCTHSAQLEDGLVLCSKKGLKTEDSSCRRFRYDPCKRIPRKAKALDFSRYENDNFTLND